MNSSLFQTALLHVWPLWVNWISSRAWLEVKWVRRSP